MDFSKITVEDPEQAKVARDRYMEAARRSRSAMDRALAKSYAALAEGRALIDLDETMRAAGVDEVTKLPKLAVVRADFKQVFLRMVRWGDRDVRDSAIMAGVLDYTRDRVKTAAGTARFDFPTGTFPVSETPRGWMDTHSAPVPLIPPQLRPADAYRNYFILWEVKEWKRVAPLDPLLLTHIQGHIFAVVAQWDLSPIERLVMNAALRRGN